MLTCYIKEKFYIKEITIDLKASWGFAARFVVQF